MKKIDYIFGLAAGIGVGWLFSSILEGYNFQIPAMRFVLMAVFSIVAVIALWLANLIGKKFLLVSQGAKFLLIGALATLIDLSIFKILIALTSFDSVSAINVFKGASFLITTFIKYWGNKFWAFEQKGQEKMGTQLTQFYAVTVIGLGINVAVFYFWINILKPQFSTPADTWSTMGIIASAVVVSIFNFLGYKFFVFKKNNG